MGTQISLKLSKKMITSAKDYAEEHGFDNLQDLIRELLRKKLFEEELSVYGGKFTAMASEASLARNWLSKEEDKAWKHLQKET